MNSSIGIASLFQLVKYSFELQRKVLLLNFTLGVLLCWNSKDGDCVVAKSKYVEAVVDKPSDVLQAEKIGCCLPNGPCKKGILNKILNPGPKP